VIQGLMSLYRSLGHDPLSRLNILELILHIVAPTHTTAHTPAAAAASSNDSTTATTSSSTQASVSASEAETAAAGEAGMHCYIVDTLLSSYDSNDVIQSSMLLSGILRVIEGIAERNRVKNSGDIAIESSYAYALNWLSATSRTKLLHTLASTVSSVTSNDAASVAQCISTISCISCTLPGLMLLTSDEHARYDELRHPDVNPYGILLWHMARCVTSTNDLYQLASLHAITRIIQSPIVVSSRGAVTGTGTDTGTADRTVYDDIDRHKIKLFDLVGAYVNQPTVTLLVQKAQLPFADLRFKSIALLDAAASQRWGVSKLLADPAFLSWLLDRRTEDNNINGMTAKYSVVSTLLNNPVFPRAALAGTVSDDIKQRLVEYQQQGAFYKERVTRVMSPQNIAQ
jgi:hypothetical protein